MKNKLSATFSQGFQSGAFIRVGENRDLSLFVGKDEKGNYAFDFRGSYVPVKIAQSDVITVQQGKSGENYILRFSLCNNELLEYFCNIEVTADFPYISFIFKLLLNILLNNNEFLPDKTKTVLINKFIEVANVYLSSCYNPALLENEKEILCIPVHHLFSWYLTKAGTYKSEKPLEYIKTLRTLLKRIPESKPIVEFLIDNFQKEDEVKKQEMIKNASPELVALAEQLKTMLSAFPENSPELLAIKQSPMYKQVAFLIEN
jgi:hypothetical protein